VPNRLRQRIGSASTLFNADAVAKAEAALSSLSSNFTQWLADELGKLETARDAMLTDGVTEAVRSRLFLHAHDLKGLGSTYGFPIISRIAGSLCRLLEAPGRPPSAAKLVNAHVDAIRAAVRDNIRDECDATSRVLADELERQVSTHTAKTDAAGAPRR
jgi:chemotaxis protein histidine kinase CheA